MAKGRLIVWQESVSQDAQVYAGSTTRALDQSERRLRAKVSLGFINRDFTPGTGWQIVYCEGPELNAAQPDDFMAQRLEEPPDLPVFSLRQRHIEMRFPS